MTGHETMDAPGHRATGTAQFHSWGERMDTLRSHYQRLQHTAEEAHRLLARDSMGPDPLQLGITATAFERETFRIMVLGEFSSGKSTLINALVGKKLLPAKANPATAFTTVLRWGETEQALLYRDLDRRTGATATTIEEFKRAVSLELDADGEVRPPSFALAVVEQPLELLRRSVEIVDSAGINESPDREQVTLRFLEEVDAVLFVTDAGRPFTLNETQNYLKHIKELGHRDIFFVVNQFDRIDEEDQADVMSRCRNLAAGLGGTDGPNGANVFFVSARDALRARLSADAGGEQSSGITGLERALEKFCLRDAERVKFVRLAEFLRHNAVYLRKRLQDEGAVLMKSTAELQELLEASRATQDRLRASAEAIRNVVNSRIEDVQRELQLNFTHFMEDMSSTIPSWDVSLSGQGRKPLQALSRGGREAAKRRLEDEYTRHLQRRIQIYITTVLEKLIETRQADLLQQVSPLMQAHAELYEGLRTELTGSRPPGDQQQLIYSIAVAAGRGTARTTRHTHEDIPLFYRPNSVLVIGAGTGAALAGGAAAATTAGVISLGIAVPPVGVAMAIGAAIGPLLASWAVIFADGKLRERAAAEMAAQVKESAGRSASQYAVSLAADLRAAWGGLADSLHAQIQEMIGMVQRNINESQRDEQVTRDRRDRLYEHEQQITEIERLIGTFLQPLVTESEREPARGVPPQHTGP